jgi:hypothetical protein
MKTKSRAGKARPNNGPSKHVGSGRLVRLLCRKCGAKTYTKRESYEPEAVKTVVCVCPKCDNGGGFDDLQYLDAKGRDLGDIYAKPNIADQRRSPE